MFYLVIAVHVLICLLLILIVLIQQGRGGGLIDSFSSAESIFGTKTNTFLVKATSVLAAAFFLTCLMLAFLSLQKGKSLIETRYRPEAQIPAPVADSANKAPSEAPAAGTAAAVAPAEVPEAVAPEKILPPAQENPVPTQEGQELNTPITGETEGGSD